MNGRELLGIAALLLTLAFTATDAMAAAPRRADFDHLRTGFPLTGAHATTACETCHVGGRFRGTPTQCTFCHSPGSRIATTSKPAKHVPTNEPCEQCHRSAATWSGARFSHAMVQPGSCASCHNTVVATGKPATHVVTNEPCDQCHRPHAWLPALAGALPANHRPVPPGAGCTSCHAGGNFTFTHPTSLAGCAGCHNGTTARGRPGNSIHTLSNIPTCETCHRNITTFTVATFSHNAVTTGSCSNCHNGANPPAMGKPNGHQATAESCDACHNMVAWLPAFSTTLPANHRPVPPGYGCTSCHTGGSYVFVHPSTMSGCATCHNGSTARAKPGNAIHTFSNIPTCETCHRNTSSFLTATFSHTAVAPRGCTNCHNGSNPPAMGKSGTHMTTTESCDVCHRTSAWLPALIGNTLPANHRPIPPSTTCSSCHVGGSSVFTHPSTTSGCTTCHNGSTARGQPANAIHMNSNITTCESCHRNTSSFTVATFTHSAVTPNGCANCHNGSNPPAVGKKGTHFVTTRACDACHTTTAWSPTTRYTHSTPYYRTHNSGVTCTNCHTGNSEVATWTNSAYKPDCAGCHAGRFKPDAHKKVDSPKILYTVAELKDCSGSCHEYTDSTFTTIKKTRSGEHRSTDGGF
jgi:hypothetical protein